MIGALREFFLKPCVSAIIIRHFLQGRSLVQTLGGIHLIFAASHIVHIAYSVKLAHAIQYKNEYFFSMQGQCFLVGHYRLL